MQNAFLVGLTSVDPAAYGGWDGRNGCWGCELDVDNIDQILSPIGYKIATAKTRQATASAVLDGLHAAAKRHKSGDTFVFYFSGHGGQQPDTNADEMDGQDETLVAYDREIIDDELNEIWLKFKKGVRIVMISDSCNSGTNYRAVRDVSAGTPWMPLCDKTATTMKAQMIHLGGCRDGWTSSGYLSGGAFTQSLCKVWDGGRFTGNYEAFLKKIRSDVTSNQIPQHSEYGPVSDEFRNEKPFSSGTRSDGSTNGSIAGVKCVLDIQSGHLRDIKNAIHNEAEKCILEALDDAMSQRPGAASLSCTGSSGGGMTCTGTVIITW